jgi:hypothetical protein
MEPREREFHLELGSGCSQDAKSSGSGHEVLQQSRLAHTGLAP